MNNKIKNILAGACLGLVGIGCLTCCSMSDEQKKALDLVTEKSDEIVNLLEENLEYKNKQLSKEDAAEKILLARSRWKLLQFDEFEYSMIQNSYYGMFDKLKSTYTSDATTPWRWIYRNTEDTKVFATAEGVEFDSIRLSNFNENKTLEWSAGENSFTDREYDSYDFLINIDVLDQIGITTITSEQIKDIEIVENGYVFRVLIEEDNSYSEVTFNVTFDNYITSFIVKNIMTDEYNGESWLESWLIECQYKYDNVDFTALDAKIVELSSAV